MSFLRKFQGRPARLKIRGTHNFAQDNSAQSTGRMIAID
jgi:hypothetical protein